MTIRLREIDKYAAHELLHGASLVAVMLEHVGSGDVHQQILKSYPEVNTAYTEAQEAVSRFYQACGVFL